MNKETGLIILNLLIVIASLVIVYSFYYRLTQDGGDTVTNYALFVGFALFAYINFRKLIRMIKERKK